MKDEHAPRQASHQGEKLLLLLLLLLLLFIHSNRSRLLSLALRLVAVHCTGASRALNHMDKVEFRYE